MYAPTAVPSLVLLPGDIVLTRARTGILGPLIRWFQTRPGDPARFNHVAIVTSLEPQAPEEARITEALWHVKSWRLWDAYGPPAGRKRSEILIYRLKDAAMAERIAAAREAETFIGLDYGWRKLLAHAADRWISGKAGREVYAFRSLLEAKARTPICSQLVQMAWGRSSARWFGVPPGAAQPDDFDDFRTSGVTVDLLGPGLLGSEIDGAKA